MLQININVYLFIFCLIFGSILINQNNAQRSDISVGRKCACNSAGSVGNTCETPCKCKPNVEGTFCDRCRHGYYHLQAANSDGCSKCFCFNRTLDCTSSDWPTVIIGGEVSSGVQLSNDIGGSRDKTLDRIEMEGVNDEWMVASFSNKRPPVRPMAWKGHLAIAGDEMTEYDRTYYWQAPDTYLGKRLYSYGNQLSFEVGYTVLRGDVSGFATQDADLILQGGPYDLSIGYRWTRHEQKMNSDARLNLSVPLREQQWVRLDSTGRPTDEPVSREQFTLVLYDLKRLLVRAKFHTDQIEGRLYSATLAQAKLKAPGPIAVGTEKCACPPGYTGLSCEECAAGYKAVQDDYGVRCEPCACNGHSLVCDPRCECLHNTTGADCGHCAEGFYGNPLRGTPDDCKPCKCPPGARCTSTLNGEDFRCAPCPTGHVGDHCDQCDYGYFGQPKEGIPCQRCQCAPGIDVFVPGACDPITGQCRCSNNTGGVKCDECLPDHWGNPLTPTGCRPCACNPRGSVSSQCNRITGACQCRRNFAGQKCDRCAAGFGNVALDCPPCNCNVTGSLSVDCEPITGKCDCKPGVTGDRCDRCAPEHYGFSEHGCKACACHAAGSLSASCDVHTGQCVCLDGFQGRDCSECVARHVRVDDRCLACDDGVCLTALLDDLEHIKRLLDNAALHTLTGLPAKKLAHLAGIAGVVANDVQHYRYLVRDSRQRLENVSYAFDTDAFVDILNLKAIELAQRAPILLRDTQNAGESAQHVLQFVNQLIDELFKLVEMLRHYRPYNVLQDVQRLLREAEQVHKQLSGRAFKASLEEAQRELRKAHALFERVGSVLASPAQHGPLLQRLDQLSRLAYESLQIVQEHVQKPILGAIEYVSGGRQLHVQVSQALSNSTHLADAADAQLSTARHLVDSAKQLLLDLQLLLERLPGRLEQLANRSAMLDNLHKSLIRLAGQQDPTVAACAQHASELLERVAYLKNMFLPSEQLSRYAMRAANVYQSIVEALAAAADAARRAFAAAERAQSESSGGSGDRQPLATRASDALKNAQKLLESAKQLRDSQLSELERQLHYRLFALDKLSEQMTGSENTLHLVTRELTKISSTYVQGAKPDEARLRELLKQLDDLHKRLDELEYKIRNELLARLERLKDSSPSGLESLGKLIEKARLDIRNADKLAYSAEQRWARMHKHKQQLGISLRELWQRIQQARHRAGSVRVSLGPNANGICIRSYEPPNDGPLFTSVAISYATRDASKNSLLFWLGAGGSSTQNVAGSSSLAQNTGTQQASTLDIKQANEFIAIELVERHIRLLWNLGGGTQTIQHPMTIEPNDPGMLNDSQWYRITVTRVGNAASLSVQRVPLSDKVDAQIVRGMSAPGHTRLPLNAPEVQLLVGGFPAGFEPPRDLRTRSFAGCLYELNVNGRRIGLWNFRTNVGCAGCREGATPPYAASAAQFTRPGYALLPQPSRYDPRKYLLALQMRTLQEHALLLFAGNSATSDFFALSISQGRLRLQLSAGGAKLELHSRLRYNTGQWVRVAAERDRHEAILSVDDEIIEGTLNTAGGGSASPLLELAGSLLHVGGVPPNFSHADWPDLDTASYLGCVNELQVDSTPLWVLGGEHHGVELGCQSQLSWQAAFTGHGFVELSSKTLAEDSDLSLSFHSKQTDALLLLSTFEGQPKTSSRDSHYYSLALVGGHLEARLNGGAGETVIISDAQLNDGLWHSVTISKRNRKVTMSIDDVETGISRMERGTRNIEGPESGGLYLGGIPDSLVLRGMAATKQRLDGELTELTLDGQPIAISEPVRFENVRLGPPTEPDVAIDRAIARLEKMITQDADEEVTTEDLL